MKGGFGVDVNLGVIRIAVDVETIAADDLAQGKHIDNKSQRFEDGALRHSLDQPFQNSYSIFLTAVPSSCRGGAEPALTKKDCHFETAVKMQ